MPTYLTFFFFFFNDTATTEIYTLSLHDALPIFDVRKPLWPSRRRVNSMTPRVDADLSSWPGRTRPDDKSRSEEHTSELQSRQYLVCRLLLEKKKKNGLSFLGPIEVTAVSFVVLI